MPYWEYGHESVASIAWQQMRPDTRRAVAALLTTGTLARHARLPGGDDRAGERVGRLHQAAAATASPMPIAGTIQNVDVCKPFDLKAAVQGRQLRVGADRAQARLLADPKVPQRERLMALAFLVHFVGDLHQPMHAGDHADLGGNKVAANYGMIGGRTNLHSIWDGWLAERAISTPPAGPRGLLGAGLAGRARAHRGAAASRTGAARCGARRATLPTRRWSAIRAGRRRPARPTLTKPRSGR